MQQKQSTKQASAKKIRLPKFLNIIYSAYAWEVAVKCIAFIGIPYIYLLVCGMIHDSLVKAGAITLSQREAMVLFVFFSLMLFWLIGAVLSVCSIVTFVTKKRRPKKKASAQGAQATAQTGVKKTPIQLRKTHAQKAAEKRARENTNNHTQA